MRLASHVQVGALVRTAEAAGAQATVLHRGEPTSGALLICAEYPDGHGRLLARMNDRWDWLMGPDPVPPAVLADAIARQRRYDPDLWVLVITDRAGRVFVDLPTPPHPAEALFRR